MSMTMSEATEYLKSIKEWDSVWKLERELIIKWAEFLKQRELEEKKSTRKKTAKA
jgi:hypothetical protein